MRTFGKLLPLLICPTLAIVHGGAPSCTKSDSAGEHRPTAGKVRPVRIIRIAKGIDSQNAVDCVGFSSDGKLAAAGTARNVVSILDLQTGKVVRRFKGGSKGILSVAFHPRADLIASGDRAGQIRLWSIENGRLLHVLKGHDGAIRTLEFSPDGGRLLSGSRDRSVGLWNMKNGKLLRLFQGHEATVHSLAWYPDGRYFLSTGDGIAKPGEDITNSDDYTYSFQLWSTQKGKVVQTYGGYKLKVMCIAVSPDGVLIASAEYRTLHLLDLKTGRKLRSFKGHEKAIHSVTFSTNGRYLISGSGELGPKAGKLVPLDCTVRVWDVSSGAQIACFGGYKMPVWKVAFSPDGGFAIGSSADQTIRIWRLPKKALHPSTSKPATFPVVGQLPRR